MTTGTASKKKIFHRSLNLRRLEREDAQILGKVGSAIAIDDHLTKRREQINDLENRVRDLKAAIDAINYISGRASYGHDKGCECTACLIHRHAFKAWQNG